MMYKSSNRHRRTNGIKFFQITQSRFRNNYVLFLTYIIRIVLNFGPEKCLKESKVTCGVTSKRQVWSTFFLFEFFDHVSKGKFGPHSNCSKRQVCSIFGEKSGPNLPFLNSLNHVWEMFSKRQVWSRFFSEYGANLPFRAI